MKKQDYTTSIAVNATAQEAFNAILDVTRWWSEDMEGTTNKRNDVFTVYFGEVYVTCKVGQLAAGKKISWKCTDCNKPFLENVKEWKGTVMEWDISEMGKKTEIIFTHIGLTPEIECYEVCADAWGGYIKNSLAKLITTGKGKPTPKMRKGKTGKK